MRRAALALVISSLTAAVAVAQQIDLNGRWRSGAGQELEFRPTGELVMVGIGTATYRTCGPDGLDVCVAFGRYQCRYRATWSAEHQTLDITTGRPTINCPVGLFKRGPTQG